MGKNIEIESNWMWEDNSVGEVRGQRRDGGIHLVDQRWFRRQRVSCPVVVDQEVYPSFKMQVRRKGRWRESGGG